MKKIIAIVLAAVCVGACVAGCNGELPIGIKWNIGASGLPDCLEWGNTGQQVMSETFSYENWDTNTVYINDATLSEVVEYIEMCQLMGFEGKETPRTYTNGVCEWVGECDNEHHADMQISIIHWKIDQHKSDAVYNLEIMFRYHT